MGGLKSRMQGAEERINKFGEREISLSGQQREIRRIEPRGSVLPKSHEERRKIAGQQNYWISNSYKPCKFCKRFKKPSKSQTWKTERNSHQANHSQIFELKAKKNLWKQWESTLPTVENKLNYRVFLIRDHEGHKKWSKPFLRLKKKRIVNLKSYTQPECPWGMKGTIKACSEQGKLKGLVIGRFAVKEGLKEDL